MNQARRSTPLLPPCVWFAGTALLAGSLAAFNTDDHEDLVWQNRTSGLSAVWFLRGTNFPHTSPDAVGFLPKPSPAGRHIAAIADFNRDGHADLLWRNPLTGANAIWLLRGTNLLSSSSAVEINPGETNYTVVGAADFDGDGHPDIAWHDARQRTTAIWYMQATNWTGRVGWISAAPDRGWSPVAAADFDHDGLADLVWRNRRSGENALWLMNDTNRLRAVALPPEPDPDNEFAGTGRFNRLGHTDLLWRHRKGTNTIWLMEWTRRIGTVLLPAQPDTNWMIAGTGGYKTFPRLSALIDQPADSSSNRPGTEGSPSILVVSDRGGSARPTVRAKPAEAGDWQVRISDFLPNRFTNSAVHLGARYEFQVDAETLLSGVRLPPVFHRGKVLLVIEQAVAKELSDELGHFVRILNGDGWIVRRVTVPRHNDEDATKNSAAITAIKSFIQAAHAEDPENLRAVFLIGHVPVPYSGFMAPDGHVTDGVSGCHMGAWPADAFYGDIDGSWTDGTDFVYTLPNCTPHPRQINLANDGKFDQSLIPAGPNGGTPLELAVGRVDFAALDAFQPNEVELLRRYFKKNERFRKRELVFANRLVAGGFFDNPFLDGARYQEALRIGSRLFGTDPAAVVAGDVFTANRSCLVGVHGGFGYYDAVNTSGAVNTRTGTSLHSTYELAKTSTEPPVGLYLLAGSYFGDWNVRNNLLRATLAPPRSGLAAVWTHQIHWRFESVPLGETLGDVLLRTINLRVGGAPTMIALLGDPTLHLQVTAPPSNLRLESEDDQRTLFWRPSPVPGARYYVLGAPDWDSQFKNLTPDGLSKTEFKVEIGAEKALYQVRAAALVTTGSGSFTNLSQGIFLELPK